MGKSERLKKNVIWNVEYVRSKDLIHHSQYDSPLSTFHSPLFIHRPRVAIALAEAQALAKVGHFQFSIVHCPLSIVFLPFSWYAIQLIKGIA